jgi:hypothetical protein
MAKNVSGDEASGGEGAGAGGPRRRGVAPGNFQLDPGLLGWRLYTLAWGDDTVFANVIVTNTAHGSYDADEEYWFVDKTAVGTLGSEVQIRLVNDYDWDDEVPSPPSGWQPFDARTAATWALVDGDLAGGTLYKDPSGGHYLRLQKTGSSPNATLTVVRWYKGGSTQPSGTFNPSGTYGDVTALDSGSAWYADSLPPA